MQRNFLKEVSAYKNLTSIQGSVLPKLLGVFNVLESPTRELEEDRSVNVIVDEYIKGPSLEELMPDLKYHDPKYVNTLLKNVYGALDSIHELGVVHQNCHPAKFILKKGWIEGKSVKSVGIIDFTKSERQENCEKDLAEKLKDRDIGDVTDQFLRVGPEISD